MLEELEGVRVQLISQLDTLTGSLDSSQGIGNQKIAQLKEEYNNIIRRQYPRKIPGADPCKRLPAEIFLEIVQDATDLGRGCSISRVLWLTNVSTTWQNALLSAPTLWTTIDLHNRIPRQQLELELSVALHLSGNAPLHLRIESPYPMWPNDYEMLRPHRARIAKFSLSYIFDAMGGSIGSNANILATLGHLPGLRSFEARLRSPDTPSSSIEIETFIAKNSQITNISGIPLMARTLHMPFIAKFSELETRLKPSNVLLSLQRMKRLQKVSFLRSGSRGDGGVDLLADNACDHLEANWVSYTEHEQLSIQLLRRTVTTLVELELMVSVGAIGPLFPLLHLFQRLRLCHFSFSIGNGHRFTLSKQEIRPCKVTHIRIRLNTIPEPLQNVSRHEAEASLGDIVPALHQVFGYAENLSVRAWSIPILWPLLDRSGFKYLETLNFGQHVGPPPPPSFHLPRQLKRLAVGGTRSNMEGLQSKSVEFLRTFRVGSPSTASNPFDPALWPTVAKLETDPSTIIGWGAGTLKHLREIVINFMPNTKLDYVTRFCRDLALNSGTMPALDTLDFFTIPEWDVLFILLEHYNFRPEAGSSRISNITLPARVPRRLLEPLQELCAGRFVSHPCYFELSWMANMNIMSDYSLPGCMTCHKALFYCSQPTPVHQKEVRLRYYLHGNTRVVDASDRCPDSLLESEGNMNPVQSLTIDDILVSFPAYPNSTRDILTTWEQREEAWQALGDRIRPKTCLMYSHFKTRICPGATFV
ncbi:hypothetical protein FRC14_006801 [Serendipita sp. 396]|nr:hypothetical protein FRC14_006801 [Serendipita sp. 396]